MDLERAKKLFFAYDGSSFYMSRDDVAEEYGSAHVPPEKEREWMIELTQEKLIALSAAENWKVLHFLNHHRDYQHLEKVMCAEAKGEFWERCTFLEGLLEYSIGSLKQGSKKSLVVAAISKVIEEAQKLVKAAKSENSTRRASDLLNKATASLDHVSK